VLDLLSAEAADPGAPGALVIRRNLTHVLLVEALRAVLATSAGPAGWLAALADAHVGAARDLRTTSRTVASIGAGVGYPAETTFSTTFKRIMGQPPSRYRSAVRLDRVNGAGGASGAEGASGAG
jgi:AraC-like DNA-binding protein